MRVHAGACAAAVHLNAIFDLGFVGRYFRELPRYKTRVTLAHGVF